MNKLILLAAALFCALNGKAQTYLQQLSFGAGGGVATAYGATQSIKTTGAGNFKFGYYPNQYLNFELEVQAGKLAGGSLNDLHKNNFSNNYQAFTVGANLALGAFFNETKNPFENFMKNFYGGLGIGFLNNDVTNINENLTENLSKKITLVIPVRAGYEVNLIKEYNQSRLKLDIAYSVNPTLGKGLDGYNDSSRSSSLKLYTYASITLKYAITLIGKPGIDLNLN